MGLLILNHRVFRRLSSNKKKRNKKVLNSCSNRLNRTKPKIGATGTKTKEKLRQMYKNRVNNSNNRCSPKSKALQKKYKRVDNSSSRRSKSLKK